jgi:YD repeat-containing protein
MSDLARWDLRGPVRTLRTEFAEWNPEVGDWWSLENRFVATFRGDGQLSEIEHHNPDGSVPREVRLYDDAGRLTEDQWWSNDVLTRGVVQTYDGGGRPASAVTVDADGTKHETERCQYDENGRKTKVVFLPVPETSGAACSTGSCGTMYGVEGTDAAYSAPGATTSTTTYDQHERPSEVTFHDANDAFVSRVVFSRDHDGRVLSERMEFAGPGGLPGPAFDANAPADERASMMELLKTVFDDQTFWVATYAYDEKGRRIESIRRMGKLSENRVTVRYDDLDNPVEEVRSDVHREMRMDDGVVNTEESPPHVQHVRFEYRYDAHGNWTERIVWQRPQPNADERPANIERRTITYYGN